MIRARPPEKGAFRRVREGSAPGSPDRRIRPDLGRPNPARIRRSATPARAPSRTGGGPRGSGGIPRDFGRQNRHGIRRIRDRAAVPRICAAEIPDFTRFCAILTDFARRRSEEARRGNAAKSVNIAKNRLISGFCAGATPRGSTVRCHRKFEDSRSCTRKALCVSPSPNLI